MPAKLQIAVSLTSLIFLKTFPELTPSPYFFIISICPVYVNVFAGFDEIPSMTKILRKQYFMDGRTDGWKNNAKTVYQPTNFVGGIIIPLLSSNTHFIKFVFR